MHWLGFEFVLPFAVGGDDRARACAKATMIEEDNVAAQVKLTCKIGQWQGKYRHRH
jgi:hypothetical protein